MIVGIVALFTVLFFGGVQEYFFIEKLEKGVKKFVIEKDRSKEILADHCSDQEVDNYNIIEIITNELQIEINIFL